MKALKNQLVRLWNDEQGAEKIEYILLVAAVVLPLVAIIIYFSGDVVEWLRDNFDNVKDNEVENHGFGG